MKATINDLRVRHWECVWILDLSVPCTPKYLIDQAPLEVLVDVQNPDSIATNTAAIQWVH
jgi:hypothetical protein